jgi:HAD superfamily hydrolase (TIGR01509 family)
LDFLSERGIKKALVTNNSKKNVDFLLKKFDLEFDRVISRESGLWKPSGAPFAAVLEKLGLRKEECCVIGDSHFDVKAANEAGISCVLILNKNKERFASTNAEVFSTVGELQERIRTFL